MPRRDAPMRSSGGSTTSTWGGFSSPLGPGTWAVAPGDNARMIARLCGVVIEATDNELVVMTSGGVGYTVTVPRGAVPPECTRPDEAGQPVGVILRVHHHHVERQGDVLFGFSTEAQERLFHLLLGTPGLGGATAVKIMSGADVGTILSAVSTGDTAALVSVKGVGKKTAENIIHACRKKAGALISALDSGGSKSGNMLLSVIDALVASGYKYVDVTPVVRALSVTPDATVALLLTAALRELDRE